MIHTLQHSNVIRFKGIFVSLDDMPKLWSQVALILACVAGVKRGRGRGRGSGNLGARERVASRTDMISFGLLRRTFLASIECFHSRGQHLCKFTGTKESVCIRKEINSQRTGLGHKHGRCSIVLGDQYGRLKVMWKHSILSNGFNFWTVRF